MIDIGLSLFAKFLIDAEREFRDKPAGINTLVLGAGIY